MALVSYLPHISSQKRAPLQQIDSFVVARLGPTRGLGKSQPACFNRQIAMYLASRVGRWSTPSIGRFYGGRDHSTVVYSVQRIEQARLSSPELDALLREMEAHLLDETQQKTGSVAGALTRKTEPNWDVIADRIAVQICERLKQELCAIYAEKRTLGYPECSSAYFESSGIRDCFTTHVGPTCAGNE